MFVKNERKYRRLPLIIKVLIFLIITFFCCTLTYSYGEVKKQSDLQEEYDTITSHVNYYISELQTRNVLIHKIFISQYEAADELYYAVKRIVQCSHDQLMIRYFNEAFNTDGVFCYNRQEGLNKLFEFFLLYPKVRNNGEINATIYHLRVMSSQMFKQLVKYNSDVDRFHQWASRWNSSTYITELLGCISGDQYTQYSHTMVLTIE